MIWDHCVRQRVRCSLPFQNGHVTQRPSVDSIWPKRFDPAQNNFGPIKGGLLFQISLFIYARNREFWTTVSVSMCNAACRFEMAL